MINILYREKSALLILVQVRRFLSEDHSLWTPGNVALDAESSFSLRFHIQAVLLKSCSPEMPEMITEQGIHTASLPCYYYQPLFHVRIFALCNEYSHGLLYKPDKKLKMMDIITMKLYFQPSSDNLPPKCSERISH